MAESVDAADLKSAFFGSAGSSPAEATKTVIAAEIDAPATGAQTAHPVHVSVHRVDPPTGDQLLTRGADDVEGALVEALRGATTAGRWDLVAALADELKARRLEGSNVVAFPRSRGGKR